MSIVAGKSGWVRMGGVSYPFREWRMRISANRVDITNFTSQGCQDVIGGIFSREVTARGFIDPAMPPLTLDTDVHLDLGIGGGFMISADARVFDIAPSTAVDRAGEVEITILTRTPFSAAFAPAPGEIMSDLSTLLGDHGAALPALEHGGKSYRTRRLTFALQAAFSTWLKGRALQSLALVREALGDEVYKGERQELDAAFNRGDYGFWGELSRQAMQTPEGLMKLTGLIFGCGEDEAFILVGEKPRETGELLGHALRESLPKVAFNGSVPDPNARAPAG